MKVFPAVEFPTNKLVGNASEWEITPSKYCHAFWSAGNFIK